MRRLQSNDQLVLTVTVKYSENIDGKGYYYHPLMSRLRRGTEEVILCKIGGPNNRKNNSHLFVIKMRVFLLKHLWWLNL